jgi:hypothetical protein
LGKFSVQQSLANNSSFTDDVYERTELLEHIVGLCDWGSLTAIGISTVKLRVIRDRVIRRRIQFFLAIFVPQREHERFFGFLRASKGGIVGGLVRCMMCAGNLSFTKAWPKEMFIVTPFHPTGELAGTWRRFLGSVNYTMFFDEVEDARPVSMTRRVIRAKHVCHLIY